MRVGSSFSKTRRKEFQIYILNEVIHIEDYYAKVLGEFFFHLGGHVEGHWVKDFV